MKRKSRKSQGKPHVHLSVVHRPLYALIEYGEQSEKLPLDWRVIRDSIKGLTANARITFAGADTSLPSDHAAKEHLTKAVQALDSLDTFVDVVAESQAVEHSRLSRAF